MLKKVHLTNFKCFKKNSINLGHITVFIGANGTGKSSAAQALLLLKQSLNYNVLQMNAPLISLGDFDDILNYNTQGKTLRVDIEGHYPLDNRTEKQKAHINFRYHTVFKEGGVLDSHRMRLTTRKSAIDVDIEGSWNSKGTSVVRPQEYGEKGGPSVSFNKGHFTIGEIIRVSGGTPGETEESIARYEHLEKFFKNVLSTVENVLKSIYLVPGMRSIDRPIIDLNPTPVRDFVSSDGPSVQARNLVSTLGYNPEISDKISRWTSKLEGSKVRQRLMPNKQQSIEINKHTHYTNVVNEGLGLNQSIFLFSQLAHSPKNSTIVIEEPELHLHPRAQGKLIDIITRVSKGENKQLILITHSEHILFRLLTLVAQGVLEPTELVVNYFRKKKTFTDVKELNVDKQGGLKGGLPGFFEEGIKEFKDYIDAVSKKD
jgi:predicted ATPase